MDPSPNSTGVASDVSPDPRLLVVLPGSRASFRRRVIDALRSTVSATAGFCFLGKEDELSFGDGTRVVGAAAAQLPKPDGIRLSAAFGFETANVVALTRRAYSTSELYPPEERNALPYFKAAALPLGTSDALLCFLHEGGVLFGVAGLERGENEPPFSREELLAVEALTPFLVAGARAQIRYDEVTREASALRALAKVKGALFVVDRTKRKVIWAADREHGIDWAHDVAPIGDLLVDAAESAISAKKQGNALPTPPRLPSGAVSGVERIDDDPVFGGGRCAVVRVEALSQPNTAALEGLSKRQREIVRLLVAGYSGANVAAICGLSENTVRTQVRRMYAKLGVTNRADLVRRLLSPDDPDHTAGPVSQIAPQPESREADDDTLD